MINFRNIKGTFFFGGGGGELVSSGARCVHPLDVLAQAVPRLEHFGTMEADDTVCVNVASLHVA
jgi:hypothetical protein